jgi:para-aminobenzoate synthetase component 1
LLSTIQSTDQQYINYPFTGGLAGYFGYDLGRSPNHKLPKLDTLPDMRIGLYEWALTIDHFSKKAWLFFNAKCPKELKNKIINCINKVPQNTDSNEKILHKLSCSTKKLHYLDTVKKAKNYILAGDCYQINYAQHFSASAKKDSWKIYKDLRIRMAAPYGCYYQLGKTKQAILSFSPERFLKLKGNQVITQPIKGTVSRGKNSQEDTIKAKALIDSEKNKAENLMIVDLLRNDLSKNCKLGSVKTPELFKLESFKNVHHLVSTVTGIIKDTATPLTLLRDCFPGGSITGAPKKRVMEIIDELELCKRSVYCGSIGYISANGLMDTNIAIRTILSDGNKIHCWGGGGIVADSDAEDEYQEILDKVGLLIKF